ncbi:hypothetical protein PYW08_010030 [Mythimna loreyi]|uniref:Uncharacterized protein n=1 Tax=Mythimna loreyi TaxID=667449 RepID=A0ACC2Q567_9NEOP|nr:hypothetical protein PYW08_010030 [Mythimna loreyi]
MGKPSSTSLSKSSECSVQLNSSKQLNKGAMSAHKMEQLKKKNHKHVRKNINKLFNRLQRDSIGSRNNSQNNSRVSSDSTPRNLTIVVKNDSFTPLRKRKSPITIPSSPNKTRRKSDSLIIINDDDLSTNNDSCIIISPTKDNPHSKINCSTPIAKRDSQNLQNLIINNFPKTKNSLNCPQSQNETKEENRTKIINRDSYLTIDLTADSENKTNANVTVIDVDKNADYTNNSQDCTLVSVSDASLSMSGDSDVTVIQNNRDSKNKQIKKFTNGIAQLNPVEKSNLLKFIAQKIFSGCDLKHNVQNAQIKTSCATETDEDAYIKEVILGESKTQGASVSQSRNSIGSNIYHPSKDVKNATGLRMIIIDGSNVAMEHTKGRMFSVEGLKICIDYFLKRGHIVKAFVPRFRCKFGKSSDPTLLDYLERQGMVVYTPSREIQGKACVPYDDRYILQCAAEFDGVVVSGDNYRDLINENKRWRYIIENRVLPFTWVNNMIMFPKDPFGRGGPTLEMLLRHPTPSNSQTETK